jgi:outer membrane lipoprotein
MKILVPSLATCLVLAGCASAPRPLQGDYAAVAPAEASARGSAPEQVRWGGSIVDTIPGPNETCIEVLGRELGDNARPRLTPDRSSGRFLACRAGFYDPAIFAPEREVTVTGHVSGFEARRIGEYEYRYPRVEANVIYLWPERRERIDYWHYDPFWPVYRPFWYGGRYVPWRGARPRSAPEPDAPRKP